MPKQRSLRQPALSALPIIALMVCGCGAHDYRDTLPLASVHGTVTCKDQLLDSGQVVFVPEKDTVGVVTTGVVQSTGAYEMETCGRAGAMIGLNRVVVRPYQKASRKPSEALPSSIPEIYSWADKTPLRFEVKPGENEYLIVLE